MPFRSNEQYAVLSEAWIFSYPKFQISFEQLAGMSLVAI